MKENLKRLNILETKIKRLKKYIRGKKMYGYEEDRKFETKQKIKYGLIGAVVTFIVCMVAKKKYTQKEIEAMFDKYSKKIKKLVK